MKKSATVVNSAFDVYAIVQAILNRDFEVLNMAPVDASGNLLVPPKGVNIGGEGQFEISQRTVVAVISNNPADSVFLLVWVNKIPGKVDIIGPVDPATIS